MPAMSDANGTSESAVGGAGGSGPPSVDEPAHHVDDHMSAHDDDHGEGHMHAEALGPIDVAAWGAGLVGLAIGGAMALVFAVTTGYL